MHPYGSVMFSLIVAVYELDVDTIIVIGHDDCGGQLLDGKKVIEKMMEKGISVEDIKYIDETHKNVEQWLTGFHSVEKSVHSTLEIIKNHPLIHKDVEVYGFIMSPKTGALRSIK